MKDMQEEPIENIVWRHYSELDANWWNPNRVLKAEFKLLERSIMTTGWIQPILITPGMVIIDGYHRWRMSQDSTRLMKRYEGYVPTATLDVDEKTAMVMTVRMNRAKGTHVAVSLSSLVQKLIAEHECTPEWIAKQIGAGLDEVYVLSGKGIFEAKNVKDWQYSKAWYPGDPE